MFTAFNKFIGNVFKIKDIQFSPNANEEAFNCSRPMYASQIYLDSPHC